VADRRGPGEKKVIADTSKLVAAIKQTLRIMFGSQLDKLAEFGLTPKPVPVRHKAAEKAQSAEVMSQKQRSKIVVKHDAPATPPTPIAPTPPVATPTTTSPKTPA
jgi:hypothetical protein